MKLATFNGPQGQRVGVVDVDRQLLINLDEPDMISLLESGADGLRRAAKKVASASSATNTTSVLALDEIELCAPVVRPRKVLALAGNYAEHIQEGGKLARQDSQTPRVFMKPPSSTVIGPGRNILLPAIAREIDWEGELAVVIGSRCKAIGADEALDHVAGYTIMNDVSERALKIWKRSENRPIDDFFDWLNGKWYDTFAPMGPWLVTKDEIPDPQTLQISTFVNDQRKQHSSTAQMIFPVARLIEYISAMISLEPGDVISTGTVAGVGKTTGNFLKAGDRVKVTISSIGDLENGVAAG